VPEENAMIPLLKKIARNGLVAATILALVGFGFAEIASLWMTSQSGRSAVGEAATAESLRYRLPVAMAGWGFVFVALTEALLHLWRARRRTKPADKPDPQGGQAPAAVLIEQILREAEAERRSPSTAPSPSPAFSENSPVHQ
jgi:hypothetical protein